MPHPYGALSYILGIDAALFVVIVDKGGEVGDSVSFGYIILKHYPFKDAFVLVLGVGAFVHQVKLLIHIEQSQKIGVYHCLQHIFAVHTANLLNSLTLQFLKDAQTFDGGMVEVSGSMGHLDQLRRVFVFEDDAAV